MQERRYKRVVGVDGCAGGWIAFCVEVPSKQTSVEMFASFAPLIEACTEIIAIDIPIGLVEEGARPCDIEARKLLGKPRSNSVFPAPVRSVLGAKNYGEACQLSLQANGKALSKQTFAITKKIMEVDALMTAELQRRVFEVHPEVCFYALNKMRPMENSKKTSEGIQERKGLLQHHFPEIEKHILGLTKGNASAPDLLDAAAAAWTAERIASGEFSRVPREPQSDSRNLRMEICY